MKRSLSALLSALLALGCLDRMAGSTSTGNTGKGTIAGRVLGPDGNGVANARVSVVGVDNNPGPGGKSDVSAIVVTGSDGTFRTDSLPDGKYNLLDAKGGQVAFVDSVAVRSDTGSDAGDAKLGAPGSATGVVRLRPEHDSRTVFLVLIGTTTFAVPKDSIGNFTLAGLAEGEYRLRVLSTLDAYAPLDTVIRVTSGSENALRDTLRLAYRATAGLPLIDNPALEFDAAHLSVRVSWKKQDSPQVAAYHVYRRARDSAFTRLTSAPIKDTFFVDGVEGGFRINQAYEYAVTVLDARGNEGLKGLASSLESIPRYRIDTLAADLACTYGSCGFDVDSAGTVWVPVSDTVMRRIPLSGPPTAWRHFLISGVSGLRTDASGGLYFLAGTRVLKYDTAGGRIWEQSLPASIVSGSQGFRWSGDTMVLWDINGRTLTYLSKDGVVSGQANVLGDLPSSYPGNFPDFRPETGFFVASDSGLVFLDYSGKAVSRWNPARHGYVRDMTRDPEGRWYLLWSEGRLDVYSPDRELLETVLLKQPGNSLYRYGALYVQSAKSLLRIRTGL